jgi:hypothetical protein
MIEYRVITEANNICRRLQRDSYHRFHGMDNYNRESDRLALFTLEPQARRESAANIDLVLSVARAYGQKLVVVKTNLLQIVGQADDRVEQMARVLFSEQWLADHQTWLDSSNPVKPRFETTGQGTVCEFYTWRPGMVLPKQQGVYDVESRQRLTRRRDIIERMWALGFAASRGRPLSIARQRWTGSREELDLITQLAEQHWDRRNTSDAAKKMVSAFRSINRYAAWPGAW